MGRSAFPEAELIRPLRDVAPSGQPTSTAMLARRTVFLFPTTHAVMRADQVLEQAGLAHEIVPRPKGVDADCGIAVAVEASLREAALAVLGENRSEPSRVLAWEAPSPSSC
jgi:hypothetical protein